MLIQLKNIIKEFDSPGGDQIRTVLGGLDLEIENGDSVAIVGPSGSGKSTLLNIIGALDRPSSGTAMFDSRDLSKLGDNSLALLRNQEIGFIFQLHHLLPQLSVLENVLIPTLPLKKQGDQTGRAKELLLRVGLGEHLDHHPAQLSGGEQQRVAVVRALINQPKLILADEPTGSLDADSSENLSDLLVQLNKEEQVTLIVVTHSMELAAKMNKTFMLKNGALELKL
jgi:lipoprotein-releasing system ATP-binding protein